MSRAGDSPAQRTLDIRINRNTLDMAVSGAVFRLQPWMRISPPFLAAKFLRVCAAGNTPRKEVLLGNNERKVAERMNARLKDEFGGHSIREALIN